MENTSFSRTPRARQALMKTVTFSRWWVPVFQALRVEASVCFLFRDPSEYPLARKCSQNLVMCWRGSLRGRGRGLVHVRHDAGPHGVREGAEHHAVPEPVGEALGPPLHPGDRLRELSF